ncbi:MAG: UDP-N-acetylglucosamine 2-epimerase (non-hydrolyzing) [Firmicutes bacterium]|nr:UDP-N-acetylglucosamine 2-epimerase (non-hydrolyzing) [Bacillota bacterium]
MSKKVKIMSIFGTRPEATKMAPVINAIKKYDDLEQVVCVTAQHRQMLDQVLEIFDLHPDHDLDIMTSRQTLTDITVKALTGLESVIKEEKPDLVLVHGDTSTTFAGALAAFYNETKLGHVEAGLRTYDKFQPFPEEMNRVLTGHLTDIHFSPTKLAKEHLLKENISGENIFITGNTAVDCLATTIEDNFVFDLPELNQIDYKNKRVITMTAHRRENIGKPLENICNAVLKIVNDFEDVEVVYAVHYNPAVRETAFGILGNYERIHLIDPLDIKNMHNLMNLSYLVLTDSGGLQEEVPSMGKPVLVLRNVTERPEGLEAGTLRLAGTEEEKIYEETAQLLTNKEIYNKMVASKNPFGDGHAAERIVAAIRYYFGLTDQRPEDYF